MPKTAPHWYKDDVPLNRLHLDSRNPRFDPISTEEEIIAQLFRTERVLAVAKDIMSRGGISPMERIGVIEMPDNPGHFIVAEGNRRICALKTLKDPRKAPTAPNRQALEKLAYKGVVPDKFNVVVFRDRETARPWLGLRHLGEQNGTGTRRWNSEQKTRYSRGTSPNQLAVEVLDRAVKSGWVDSATKKKVPLTTLTRYLGTPEVRAALGIGARNELTFTHDAREVDAALRAFILDTLPRPDNSEPPAHSRSNAEMRKKYARSLHAKGIAPKTLEDEPRAPPPPTRGAAGPKPRNPRHPGKRLTVVPLEFTVQTRDKTLIRLLDESRRLKPIEEFEFASNYLLRAIVERVLVLFAQKCGRHSPHMSDQKLMQACVDELEKAGVSDSDLKNMRVANTSQHAAHSLHTLGSAVHGGHVPTRRELTSAWDNWEKALNQMLSRL